MKSKAFKKLIAVVLATVCLPCGIVSVPAREQVTESAEVSVVKAGDTVTIGNAYMSREFSVSGGTLRTAKIVNKRTDGADTVFLPGEGSEEFKIRLTKKDGGEASVHPAIDKTGWAAEADSYQFASGKTDGNAGNLIDGDLSSIWHTNYDGGTGRQEFPYHVTFQLGKAVTFQCFSYTPRDGDDGELSNGNLKEYELYYSNSAQKLEAEDDGWTLLKKGSFLYDGLNPIYVNLDAPCTARQLKLKALSANNGANFGGGAEFDLHEQKFTGREFASGDLTLKGEPVIEDTQAVVQNTEKRGKKVTFHFEPFTFQGIAYTVSEVIVMYDGDHFMRKYMEISVPEDKQADAAIDYIDLESLNTNDSDAVWTIPKDAGDIVGMDAFKANLGQPIYIQGMFFGCEFPAADNEIADGVGYLRYYTGKSFERLKLDHQLTRDGKYVTWQTVAGAARSADNAVIQEDFFAYIQSIATPFEFRIQYNSWFDNMMRISDENILESFIEIDRSLNQEEVRPLDSYVVDDGWVNYNDTYILDAERSGVTMNHTGFWEFNSKFPEGLAPSSELVHNFGSNFGVWIGPRGGYNFNGSLADILVKSGKGSKAGGSIDVADRTYVKNFTDMAVEWMKDYGVNYWKWDGFADREQYNEFPAADGVAGYANRHMTGGYQNMYHVTDLWEAWIDLMETVRQCEKENQIENLWISLTCYVNPSPWYLQWANSVWIQCLYDQSDAGASGSKMDRQMTYRDAVYYDFAKNHEFQFPFSNIYNHDPIYGKEETGMDQNTATDEQFKNYLYMMATRGTAFWELYFSDSILTDGKYEVTGEFLEWVEENYHILKNSKMFGQSPSSGVKLGSVEGGTQNAYGYACFDGTDGILSFRNAADTAKSVTICFDRTIGVPKDAGVLKYHIEHSHNLTRGTQTTGTLEYGRSYTFVLQPDEVRILRVSKDGDVTAPEIRKAYSDGANKITVKFSEKVNAGIFRINGAAVGKKAGADQRTFHLTVNEEALKDNSPVTVAADNVYDLAGNALAENEVSFIYHKENKVADSKNLVTKPAIIKTAQDSLTGSHGFSVLAEICTLSNGAVLSQGGEYAVGIQEDGTAYFALNGTSAVSKTRVNDGIWHAIAGVKENNGMLKIYVDGQLEGAGYTKENRNYDVKAADLMVGSDRFLGLANVQVLDAAIGYDAAEEFYAAGKAAPPAKQNWALLKSVTAKWTSDDSDATSDYTQRFPLSNVVDGVIDTNNYGDFGVDGNPASSYLEIDFGTIRNVSEINLYRYWEDGRTYGGTVIALSKTADFSDKTIVYNSDAENFHGLGVGTDAVYAETAKGKNIRMDRTVKARYVRVYMHGRDDSDTNHVVELEALGAERIGEADYALVDAAIAEADALNREEYKDFSHVDAAIAAVVRGKDEDAQAEVTAMAAAIFQAIAGLEKTETPNLKEALWAALEAAEAENLEEYTNESIAAYQKILSDAKSVLNGNADDREAMAEALAKVNGAKSVLVKKDASQEPEEKEEARRELLLVMEQAAAYQDASQYTAESWNLFCQALSDAKNMQESGMGTKEEIDAVRDRLKAAILGLQPVSKPDISAPDPEDPRPDQKPADLPPQEKIQKGGIYTSGSYRYKVTSLSAQTVEVTGGVSSKLKKISIPGQVKLGGKNYKVTAIGASAFKNNRKLQTVVVGKNVTIIGKNAFSGCKKLNSITIKSKKLKKAGKNAFKGIHKKAVIKVPAVRWKKYQKLLKKKGQSGDVIIKR